MQPKSFKPDRDFAILFAIMLITGTGNTALQSVLPAIGRSLHAPDFLIPAIFSVSALIWVFAAPYWARRSDRQGRRRMVIIGIGGFTFAMAFVAIFLLAGVKGWMGPLPCLFAVLCARMIYGSFGSASPPASQAMVALKTSREQRVKALTLLGSAFGIGTVVGPALAPVLMIPGLDQVGPAFAFALIGLIAMFAALAWLSPDSAGEARGANMSYPTIAGAPAGASAIAAAAEPVTEKLTMRDPRIWPWMVAGFIMGHAQALTGMVTPYLVIDRLAMVVGDPATQHAIALVLMIGAGASLLVQWGFIPILNLAPRGMLVLGLALAAAGLILTSTASTLYGIAAGNAVAAMGFGFTRPSFTAGSSLAVGRKLQGLVAGLVTSVNGASFVVAPWLGVLIYGWWKPLPFLISAVALLLMIPYAKTQLRDEA